MFEDKIGKILGVRNNTAELLTKLKETAKPYNFGYRREEGAKDIFSSILLRIPPAQVAEHEALERLQHIGTYYGINNILILKGFADIKTSDEYADRLQSITMDDFFIQQNYYQAYSRLYSEKRGYTYKKQEFDDKKLIFKEELAMPYFHRLLECLKLMIKGDLIESETYNKIYKIAGDGKTFVFLGCKVTHYKNNNTVIQFSDSAVYNEFKKNMEKGYNFCYNYFKNKEAE